MTPSCLGPLFWSTALVQCSGWFTEPTAGSFGSPDAQDYFHDVEDKWKKGVEEKAEAIIIESGHKVDSDDERKKVYL